MKDGVKKTFLSTLGNKADKIYYLHFPVPKRIVVDYKKMGIDRFIAHIGDHQQHSAILSAGNDQYFIIMNQKNCKKLGLQVGDKVSLTLTPDESEYGMPMPEELQESLEIEENAWQYFQDLTPGKQRALIHQVNSAKRQETRIRRALGIAAHLEKNKGVLDFKSLRDDIKTIDF